MVQEDENEVTCSNENSANKSRRSRVLRLQQSKKEVSSILNEVEISLALLDMASARDTASNIIEVKADHFKSPRGSLHSYKEESQEVQTVSAVTEMQKNRL